jgi:hypothetical protein
MSYRAEMSHPSKSRADCRIVSKQVIAIVLSHKVYGYIAIENQTIFLYQVLQLLPSRPGQITFSGNSPDKLCADHPILEFDTEFELCSPTPAFVQLHTLTSP